MLDGGINGAFDGCAPPEVECRRQLAIASHSGRRRALVLSSISLPSSRIYVPDYVGAGNRRAISILADLRKNSDSKNPLEGK